ncbi:hypothetical protein NE850_38660 [Paraburkholderia sp. USG1]|uniref:GTPase-associated system all-helical protein GASH n=1 Tax=Paraburkholderia sp. USG1 TaxID=2952268 RepID=UPI0028584EF2|nr:GTPase-associated system all-helical protein GASH [Paraburkholderia sp. USG1]MDR8402243.1 hypothetical protein [Paraburkholderia sp. USG1]
MAIDTQHLGMLYKRLGMTVNADLVERRAAVLSPLETDLSVEQALPLLSILFNITPPTSALDWFLVPLREDEPGFAPDDVDGEVRVLAAATLRARITKNDETSKWVSLAIEAASFGGMLDCLGDSSLAAFAQKRLAEQQVSPSAPGATYRRRIDIATAYKPAETAGASNQWLGAHAAVKKTIEDSVEYTEQGLLHQAIQTNSLRDYVVQLEEQVQTQWWAIAGWSESAGRTYSEQTIADTVVRAAIELADICETRKAGPISAPSLLDMTIARGRKVADLKKLLTVKNIATATPLEWRRTRDQVDTTSPYSRLTPALLALALATDSNDEADWAAQFSRKLALDIEAAISPIAMATQVFREVLVARGLP